MATLARPPMTQTIAMPHTQALARPRANCKPIVRWVGGKKWLVPTIAEPIYQRLAVTKGRYIEPFLGGGAIALDLGLPGMILGDMCEPLITMYQAIVRSPDAVAFSLQQLIDRGTDEAHYYHVRARPSRSPVLTAARFIFLNKLGFNGLYRENARGQCNTPYGKDPNKGMPELEHFRAVATALRGSHITNCDARTTIALAGEGDIVYVDPPYLTTFSNYTSNGFGLPEHTALAASLRDAHHRGAAVIASNTDHELIRELYAWASIIPIHERHVVAAAGDRRDKKPALLITSDSALLGP